MIEGTITKTGANVLGGDMPGQVYYGVQGPPGGHYIPNVNQIADDTAEISFTPSTNNMPSVDPVQIKLPKNKESGGNVDLEGYATEQWVRDQKYLTEHQDISHLLDADKLQEAVNEALAEAKASGEFDGEDGKDGYTPVKGIDYFDGQPGKDGADGKDGYTPVKGVDYFDGIPGKDGIDGKDGSDGYTPVKGKDYFDGNNGQDGTSVTVTKVTESTEDGGSNVVEFSDGKTLTVKNGKNGEDATAPDAVRYGEQTLTEAQKAQARQNIGTVKTAGWSPNKNIGTDENGNVIEKDDIFSKDVSAWKPVEYMNGVSWTEKGYYWQANGTHTNTQYTQEYQSTTNLIRIEPGCEYTLSNFAGSYFLYDSTGKNGAASTRHNDPNTPVTFSTNANQYYIGISHAETGVYTVDRVSLVRNNISQAEYDALPTRADSLKPLYGKTVVCFGDSLFGMYRGANSTPAFVAAETGATVHNVGFGGCRMSVHHASGYAAFSMWALAKAIAENNWSTQDAQVSSGSDYFPEQLSLLKSIDFNEVDIAVIHYGTNDFGAGNVIEIDNPSDPDDYNTLCGALRYSIEKLLGKYPNLRIYVSLPVYRFWTDNGVTTYAENYLNIGGKKLSEFVEAMRNVAAEYNLPVIDGYYGLGINKANAATFLSDGTHHNAIGRERFGRFIGANLTGQQTTGKSGMDTDAVNTLISVAIGNAIGGSY